MEYNNGGKAYYAAGHQDFNVSLWDAPGPHMGAVMIGSYETVHVHSDAERVLKISRLACAYLASKEPVNYDADKAALEFGGGKGDSFKRQIWVITKKIKDYKGHVGDVADGHGEPTTPKGNKRKAGGPPSTVKSSNKKGRKARGEEFEAKSEPAKTHESEVGDVLT